MTTIDDDAKAIMERACYLKDMAQERRVITSDLTRRIVDLRKRAEQEIADPVRLKSFLAQLESLRHSLMATTGQ